MRVTGLKNGVVTHHTRKLEDRQKIQVKRKRGNTRFFPKHMDEYELVIFEMLRRKTTREIIMVLLDSPKGLTFSQIIDNLGKAQSTISEYMQILLQEKVVQIRLDQRQKFFQLKKIDVVNDILKRYDSSLLTQTIHNFKDMFEML